MIRLFAPAQAPVWLRPVLQSIERAIRSETAPGEVVIYSGSVPDNADLLLVSASAAPVTVTLPFAAAQKGRTFTIKKTDATANAVTIDGSGAETIDGAATTTLTAQWQAKTLRSDGTAWYLI